MNDNIALKSEMYSQNVNNNTSTWSNLVNTLAHILIKIIAGLHSIDCERSGSCMFMILVYQFLSTELDFVHVLEMSSSISKY